jgi:hypothetical protein
MLHGRRRRRRRRRFCGDGEGGLLERDYFYKRVFLFFTSS